MSLGFLALLALVQGATEWLPVSSSAHLVLLPLLLGAPDQGPMIDAAAHVGSLGALMLYFRGDMARLAQGGLDVVRTRSFGGTEARLLGLILIATPPGVLAGLVYALTDLGELVRQPLVIATATLVFALPLWLADHFGKQILRIDTLSWRGAILIGLSQALAFVPGVSRSGITMTVARALGLERTEAARFGMLVGLPLLGVSGAYALLTLATDGAGGASLLDGLTVAGLSFVAAYASIAVLMALVARVGFLPFVLYRLALAAVLVTLFL